MILEVIDQGRLEKQETERTDYIMPYLQDLVQQRNESPFRIRFGREDES